jgi:hypothetical protein
MPDPKVTKVGNSVIPLKPTRDDIYKLGLTNPIVHTVLGYLYQGTITWEEAMMGCVMIMAETNEQQADALRELYNHINLSTSNIKKALNQQ